MYIDGVGIFLFEHNKETYAIVPFLLGSYTLSRVIQVAEFVKEVEYFCFGEMNFHRNESHNKVVDYCKETIIHFEYTDFWDKDEETFRNAKNITALKKKIQAKHNNYGWKRQDFRKG